MSKRIWYIKTIFIILILSPSIACSSAKSIHKEIIPLMDWTTPDIPNLSVLSISHLRNRQYGSKFVKRSAIANNSSGYSSFMLSYESDGLTNYARIDIPQKSAPIKGYPVLFYSHGWVGIDNAPLFNFFLEQNGSQAKYIDNMAKQGYVVITPGWRGHGTVNGVPAQGIEFMQRWDNASYISPIFYAIDMLNALDSLNSLASIEFSQAPLKVDINKIVLSGHSQGADSALVMLAIAGEQSSVKNTIAAASIFSGCFLPRLVQGGLYGAMATSPEAFMSGDGTWTKSAIGKEGEINPNFQFPYPPAWIDTVDPNAWSWQKEVWSVSTVELAFVNKYNQMYEVLNKNKLTTSNYRLTTDTAGKASVEHPTDIKSAYSKMDAINYPLFLSEPLALHYSDRDYYSPPFWNKQLADSLTAMHSKVALLEYKGNTHSLTISEHKWFSEDYNEHGIDKVITHDLKWFSR
jgi:dienelactone hydrolase